LKKTLFGEEKMAKKKKQEKQEAKSEVLKVDLACGQSKQEGFVGVDIVKLPGVDIVHNLEVYPWPFEDNSVDEVFCSHYVEHTPCLMKFMNELHRIMKIGAKCTVLAPYYTSMRCWQDPTHLRAISEASFLYYNKQWRVENKLDHYPITCDFDFSYGYVISQEWATRNEEARLFAIKHYWNVVSDIQVTLVKK
jgi:SAM-dependent methyltransferase